MTTQTQTTAAAVSGASDSVGAEAYDWLQMPFVRIENGEVVEDWAPPEITGASEENTYCAECALGAKYACDLVGHLKSHGDTFDGSALANVTAEIVRRGKWTGFEIGFFHALGNHIAWGRIPVSGDFDAALAGGAAASAASSAVANSCDADRFLFALIENMEALEDIAGNMVPDGSGGTHDRLNKRTRYLNRQIMNTRAQSIQGLAWKLRQLVSTLELEKGVSKYEIDMAQSALADACSLGGGMQS